MTHEPEAISQTHFLFALIGLGVMAFVGLFIFASTLIAPIWAVIMMGAIWLGAAVWAWKRWRTSMFAPLLAAVGVGVMWIVVVNVGDVLLDWNA